MGRLRHLLLVEDEPSDVDLVREALVELGCDVRLDVAEDGYQALDYLRRQSPFDNALRPDLVLLDLNLPRLHGRNVLKAMKMDPALCTIPTVVMSTASTPAIIAECRRYADHYVAKARVWPEFTARLRPVLRYLQTA
jgi:chemotaxis family two-component system response regulator Rcp1